MKRFLIVLLVSIGLAAPANAGGPYVSVFGGVNFQDDIDGTGTIPTLGSGPFTVETKTGFVVGGAAGYKWNFTNWSLSLEGEGSYRQNDVDNLSVPGFVLAPGVSAGGDIQIAGIMANVIFAYETPTSTFIPYLGGGVGVGIVNAKVSVSGPPGAVTLVDDSDTGFAYQFMAGVGYKITPMIILAVEYRLFGVTSTEFDIPLPGAKAEFDNIINHAIMMKLTHSF